MLLQQFLGALAGAHRCSATAHRRLERFCSGIECLDAIQPLLRLVVIRHEVALRLDTPRLRMEEHTVKVVVLVILAFCILDDTRELGIVDQHPAVGTRILAQSHFR